MKTITAGCAFEVPVHVARGPVRGVRQKLTSYINHEFGGTYHSHALTELARTDEDQALDRAFGWLSDRGAPFGLSFDIMNPASMDADGVARYGWIPTGAEAE